MGTMTCDRRMYRVENADHWVDGKFCSYCGSLNPDIVMSRLVSGEAIIPTDKNYKAYLGGEKVYFQHFTEKQKAEFIRLYNHEEINIDFPGHFYVLPYFAKGK